MRINRLLDTKLDKCRFNEESSFRFWCRWPQVCWKAASFFFFETTQWRGSPKWHFSSPLENISFYWHFFPPQPMLAPAPCELRGLPWCVSLLRVKILLFGVVYALLTGVGTRVASERGVLPPHAPRSFQGDLAAASIAACWMCHSFWHSFC